MQLTDADNAPSILFRQAALAERRDRPRFMIPRDADSWTPVTWQEYAQRVQWLASFLMSRGVDAEVKVAVLSSTGLDWGVAGMAVLAARGTLVPVYPSLTPAQLAHILGHSDAEVLFVEDEALLGKVLQVLEQTRVKTIVSFQEIAVASFGQQAHAERHGDLAAGSAVMGGEAEGSATGGAAAGDKVVGGARLVFPPGWTGGVSYTLAQAEQQGREALHHDELRVMRRTESIRLQDVAYLIYTSGTTGLPKGVILSHLNVGQNGADWVEVNGAHLAEGDVDLLWLPLSHIFGWGELCLGNQLGFLTYFSNPTAVLAHLPLVRPQVLMSVPAYWEKLAQMARASSPEESEQMAALRRLTGGRLRFCLSGGAGLHREVKELFLRAGLFIVEGYGLTECSPTLTMNRREDYNFSSVGKPFPNVQLKLAEDGEILARGENVFVGYYKDEPATRAAFDEEGWLRTGDLGRFTADNFLQIVDRKKDILVTSGGKNIPPQNIEMLFRDDPLIAYLIVYGEGKKYLTAMVDIHDSVAEERLKQEGIVIGEGQLRDHPRLRQWLEERIQRTNEQLAPFETIKRFCLAPEPFLLENDLLTPSLKVRRAKVYERYRPLFESLY